MAVPLHFDTTPAPRRTLLRAVGLALLIAALATGCGDSETSGDGNASNGSTSGGLDSDGVITADDDGAKWNNGRLLTGTTGDDALTGGEVNDGEGCGDNFEREVFRLLNEDRADNGLPALNCNIHLIEVARLHSEDMADRGYFAHTNPEGEQPWDRLNRYGVTNWLTVGENIARGDMTPAVVEQLWMDSPGHRANILNGDFTHIGVGVYRDGNNTTWTQLFARF